MKYLKSIKDFGNKCLRYLRQSMKSLTIWFNTCGMALLQIMVSEPTLIAWFNTHDLFVLVVIGNVLIRIFKTNKGILDK